MTLKTQAMNHMHEPAPASDWRRRPLTRVVVCLLSWWSCGVSYAAVVDFPSLPLQTGVAAPAPNVIFILDDSTSMTTNEGDNLDTGLVWCNSATCPNSPSLGDEAGAPYTKNPLSYDPHTTYGPWATANTTDTTVLHLPNATYTAVSDDLQLHTAGSEPLKNLSSSTQSYYVPKPSATDLGDQRQYYRYQIRSGGNTVARSEWVNTNNTGISSPNVWTMSPAAGNWNNGGGTGISSSNASLYYDVPADGVVSSLVIATSGTLGTNRNPNIYVKRGNVSGTPVAYPCRSATCVIGFSAATQGNNTHETLTINSPLAGRYYVGVWNSGTSGISGMTVTVTVTLVSQETTLGCTVHATNYGWKNCANVSASGDPATGVRTLAAEKQNYANWYQYHRTRMKTAKAGGSEAFAKLDENYRVGLMGLYPTGDRQQVIGGADDKSAPTATDAGNLTDIIPVDNNGGLFRGDNRKDWFEHLHGMTAKFSTPLRQALNAAGKYFSTELAYRSTRDGDTTYLACRQNFAILTTDGYWNNINGDDKDDQYTGDKISGDEEPGSEIVGPNGSYTYKVAAPYWYNVPSAEDDTSLADIAMHYWKTDLRTEDGDHAGSADNRVPTSLPILRFGSTW